MAAIVTEIHLKPYVPKLGSYKFLDIGKNQNIEPEYKFNDPDDLYLDMECIKFISSSNYFTGINIRSAQNPDTIYECEFYGITGPSKMNLECKYDFKSNLYIIYFISLDISFIFQNPKLKTKQVIVFYFRKALQGKILIIQDQNVITFIDRSKPCIEYYERINEVQEIGMKFKKDSMNSVLEFKSLGYHICTLSELCEFDNFVANIFGQEYYCIVSDNKTEICDSKKNIFIIPTSVSKIQCFDDFAIVYGAETTFYITQNDWKTVTKSLKVTTKQEHQLIMRQFLNNLQRNEPYFYMDATFLSNFKISVYVLRSTDQNIGEEIDIYQSFEDKLVKILSILNPEDKLHYKIISENLDGNSMITLMDNGDLVVKGTKKSFTFQLQ